MLAIVEDLPALQRACPTLQNANQILFAKEKKRAREMTRGKIILKRIKKCTMHPSVVSLGTAHMYHNENLDVFLFQNKSALLHLEMVDVLGLLLVSGL